MSYAYQQELLAAQRLVGQLLPSGWAVAHRGGFDFVDGERVDERQFHVQDERGRRRTFSYSAETLDCLADEIRKLAEEVRRLDRWKRKTLIRDKDLDRLAADLCPYLPRSKGTRWGRFEEDFVTPCCEHDVPAGTWWIHEESGYQGAVPAAAVSASGRDLLFADADSFGRYLLDLKENRFERG